MMSIQNDIVRLMLRKKGADLHEFKKVGLNQPAMSAVKLAEKNGLRTHIVKKAGQLTRYFAKKARMAKKAHRAKKQILK